MKRLVAIVLVLLSFITAQSQRNDYQVAVYYFPNYHVDSINERWHGKGWTEWELVKAARPRFKNHQQPKIPSWGYFDESDSRWAAKEIELASSHGVDAFIYDWYWYENTGQFLQEGLEKGFLKAPNSNKLKFALMWANHNWMNIHPTAYTNVQEKLTDGEVSTALWEKMTDYIIDTYFKKPNYWKIDNRPYFSIFDVARFLHSFKNIDEAALAMRRFDEKTKRAGFAGLHLNLIDQNVTDAGLKNLYDKTASRADVVRALDAKSITSYNFLYAYDISQAGWPTANYMDAVKANEQYWLKMKSEMDSVPYFPNVTMGWDVTPRLIQTDRFDSFKGYPWTPVFNGNNTPAAFKQALQKAKSFLDKNATTKIITINAWNEWTEGSYLLPDKNTGTGYLDAIKSVFGGK